MPRGCHETKVSKLAGHPKEPDCARCHMPARRTEDAVHVVMTDHFIQRSPPPGDLLAMRPERLDTHDSAYQGEVKLYYPEPLPAGWNPTCMSPSRR